MLIKNRRGDVSIVLLVLLVLVVTIISLFSFINNSGKIKTEISDAGIAENVYLKQNLADFYIKESGERALAESYKLLVDEELYVSQPVKKIGGDIKFDSLNDDLKEMFEEKFINNFKKAFSDYDFEKDYLLNLKQSILNEEFKIIAEKGVFQLIAPGLELNAFSEKINLNYFPEISMNFDLEKIGLESFEKIYQVKESCKSQENVKKCFNQGLVNFEAEIAEKEKSGGEKYNVVKLKTRKEFLIENRFKKIELIFISF